LIQRNVQAQIQAGKVIMLELTDLTARAFDELGESDPYI
jgi:hypothetical protein